MPTASLFNKQGERLFFNEEERSAFIEAADGATDTVRTFCNVLHYTGCNFTEAMNLTFRGIDCAGRAIVFQASRVSRAVPVPNSLIDLLDEVHGIRRAGLQADERIWPQTRMTLFTKVTPVIANSGIAGGPHATPKGIRHGFFVHAIGRRILLTRLQRWMGHSEIDYTAAHVADLMRYAPELIGDERADAERLLVIRAQARFIRQNSSGFTLVELSVVLVISSLLMVAYLDASRLWLENRRRDVTMEHISLVHDALTHYYARNGGYPCPAAPVSSPDDTKLDCTALDPAAMRQAQQHGIAFINSKTGRKIIEGAVPYRQLDIPRESTLDGWGNLFTYAVTAGLTSHDTFNANDGGIDIVDEHEKSLIDPPASALWAVVSHGPDGSGAFYDRAGAAQSCPSGRRDRLNCSHEGRFMVAPAALANNREHYDDVVFYRAWVDYLPGAAKSYCQIALPRGQQDKTPSQVQDGVMIQVCGADAQALNPNGPACQFLICRGGRLVPGVIDLTGGKS